VKGPDFKKTKTKKS